jgi:hypothetical protein
MDLNYLHQSMAHPYVVGNFLMQVGVVKMDVLQNLDAQNLDAVLTCQDEVNLVHCLQVVAVDAELRHQLKMDYYLDVVGAELRYQLNFQMKMDCYLDVAPQVYLLHPLKMLHLQQELLVVVQRFLHVKLSALQDQHRVRRLIQQRALGLLP